MDNLNKGMLYDKMLKERVDDELGLFEKYEETFSKIRDRILSYEIENVIDFGCGTGNLCGILSEKLKVIGIDKNTEMIQEGKRKYPKMDFIEGNILEVSDIEIKADIVVSSYVLHGLSLEKQRKALFNMMKLSKSKRVILIDFMFEDIKSKLECKENLLRKSRSDLWEFIDSKQFFIVEDLSRYIGQLNLRATFEHVVNFTWIAEINEA